MSALRQYSFIPLLYWTLQSVSFFFFFHVWRCVAKYMTLWLPHMLPVLCAVQRDRIHQVILACLESCRQRTDHQGQQEKSNDLVSKLFHLVPACSDLFQLDPICSSSFWLRPAYSNLFEAVPAYFSFFDLFQFVPTCSKLFHVVLACFSIFLFVPSRSNLFQFRPSSSGFCSLFPLFPSVPLCFTLYTLFPLVTARSGTIPPLLRIIKRESIAPLLNRESWTGC